MTDGEQGTKRRTIALVAIVALLALVGGAWAIEALATDEGEAARVRVTQDGRVLETFTIDELHEIESVTITQLGLTETGPPVLAVLEEAGVDDFDRLTVIGLGVRDAGILVLERDEITSEVVLDFAETRKTVKVAGPDIPREQRVRDVTELRVE